MYQMLIEKFADVLIPLICAVIVWFAVHYFVLTPRILMVEMPTIYDTLASRNTKLPNNVDQCLKSNITNIVMETGRWEAAIYTSSLTHISGPFLKIFYDGVQALDELCGKNEAAKRKAREHQKRLADEREQRQVELEKQRLKALNEARRQQLETIKNFVQGLFGG